MKKTFLLFICVALWSLTIKEANAFEYLVLVDRGYYQDLFMVDSAGNLSRITNGVPWERAADLAVDAFGNYIVAVDIYSAYGGDGLYKVTPDGQVSKISDDPLLDNPTAVTLDSNGNYVVINRIGSIIYVTTQGQVTRIYRAASGADPGDVTLRAPTDIVIDKDGHYIITDKTVGLTGGPYSTRKSDGALYRFYPANQELALITSAVDPVSKILDFNALLGYFKAIAIDRSGNYVLVSWTLDDSDDITAEQYVSKMSPSGTIVGNDLYIDDLDGKVSMPYGIAVDSNGDFIIADGVGDTSSTGRILRMTPDGQTSVIVSSDQLAKPGRLILFENGDPINTPLPPDSTNPDKGNSPEGGSGDSGNSSSCFIRLLFGR
jgi:sugar lactone lactonase YvrE